jgi:hypothetical protein
MYNKLFLTTVLIFENIRWLKEFFSIKGRSKLLLTELPKDFLDNEITLIPVSWVKVS